MKTRTSLIAATLATLIAGNAFANTHGEDAVTTMTVDSTAPIHATLLPTVSIDATSATSESNPARMRVAETEPVEVTLLPTVRVTAQAGSWQAPIESVRIADNEDAVVDLPDVDDSSSSTLEQGLPLRARSMPR